MLSELLGSLKPENLQIWKSKKRNKNREPGNTNRDVFILEKNEEEASLNGKRAERAQK